MWHSWYICHVLSENPTAFTIYARPAASTAIYFRTRIHTYRGQVSNGEVICIHHLCFRWERMPDPSHALSSSDSLSFTRFLGTEAGRWAGNKARVLEESERLHSFLAAWQQYFTSSFICVCRTITSRWNDLTAATACMKKLQHRDGGDDMSHHQAGQRRCQFDSRQPRMRS